ncbi:heterokaryon incompatibility protein-domain-containing protein [Rhexocercosporidium sp. MPI-PUGE-AT-0058]|nr:heterokaryon incompatibility protein-domain-containing protein [Rhexocercosporidium sp. MPI-PUGE-AT-0058]
MRITSRPPAYVYEQVVDDEIRVLNLFPGAFEGSIQCSLERRALPAADDAIEAQMKQEFLERAALDANMAALFTKVAHGLGSPDDKSYVDTVLQTRYIGLFQLQTARTQHEQIRETGYEALSYVWGDPENKVPILCSGYEIKVTQNLATALKYLRRTESVRQIWADAICINQQDLIEKSQQVQQMGRVYASADKTLVWLGEEHPEDKGALEQLLSWLQSPAPHIDWQRACILWESPSSFVFNVKGVSDEAAAWLQVQQVFLPPMMHLFARDWWRRKWIIQELVRAKSAVFICGTQQSDWASIQRHLGDTDPMTSRHFAHTLLLIGVMRELPYTDGLRFKSQAGMVNAHQMARFASIFHRKDPSEPERPDLVELAFRSVGFECTVAVDGLYALLGLAKKVKLSNSPHLLAVDYTAGFADMLIRFTQWFMLNRPQALVPFNHVLGNRRPFKGAETCWNSDTHLQSRPEQVPNQLPPTWTSGFFQTSYVLRRDLASPLAFEDFDAGGLKRGFRPTDIVHWNEPSTGSAMLELKGRIIGSITDIFPALHEGNNSYSFGELRTWTARILDLLATRTPDHYQASEMFYQFVTCGGQRSFILSQAVSPKERSSLEDAQRYLAIINHPEDVSLDADPDIRAFMDSIAPAAGRRLCITSSGHIGWVPPVAEKGDQICVFDGAPLLHAIAPCGGGYHNLIGPCYIEGLMFGGAMDLVLETKTINLY